MVLRLFMIVFAATSLPCAIASAEDYCLALRGNGELAPSHWGAVSNVVERLGLPRAQAGGSSGSITMFFLDAIATNKYVQDARGEERNQRAALLIKSLEGFAGYLMRTEDFQDFKLLYGQYQRLQETYSLQKLLEIFDEAADRRSTPDAAVALIRKNKQTIERAYQTSLRVGLLNRETLNNIKTSVNTILNVLSPINAVSEIRRTRFLISELIVSVKVFGSFDAATDRTLFFRPGVVDFEALAHQLGRVAQFYSALESTRAEDQLWDTFMKQCAPASRGRQWPDIAAGAGCGATLDQMIRTHFQSSRGSFATKLAGSTIKSFPTTAVLTGKARDQVVEGFAKYKDLMDPGFGMDFRLNDPALLHFGYWGDPTDLQRIQSTLKGTDDAKSARFLALGRATWAEVLRLSPAEPGLSPLRFFPLNGEKAVSAGGWSDLSPVLVLKAAGCSSVVYVTRRSGDSLFGQGVAKRLLGLNRDWAYLRTSTSQESAANNLLNNKGDSSDMTSDWSALYNLANPKSSLKAALKAADAILCTDWNAFKIQNGVRPMINDAYTSPYFLPPGSKLVARDLFTPLLNTNEISKEGYPKYAGCY